MFKMFKPNRKKWQSQEKPSSMPHRTCNFQFEQLSKSKQSHHDKKLTNGFSIKCLSNRFLQSSTSRSSNRPEFTCNDNMYSLLKQKMNQRVQIYSSQKSFRKNASLTQRYVLNGQKSSSDLMNFKKNSLLKIDLNNHRNSQPRKQFSQIFSRSKDLSSSQSFRKSMQKSTLRDEKKINCELKKKQKIFQSSQAIIQPSFDSLSDAKVQYCTIIILIDHAQEHQQVSVKYKVRKIGALIQFLKNYFIQLNSKKRLSHGESQKYKQIVSFETVDYNLQLDYYLTLTEQDGSFLNGQTIALKPFYSVKQPIVTLNSFEIIQCIGSGGFSNVYLCRFKQNGKFYAMKVISKPFIVKNQKKKIIMNERNIMVQLRDQINIAKLYYAFEAKQYIVFVMEYYEGGQLFNLVKRFRKMDQKTARFYITEVLLGLEKIHDHNIVYRDFKPENIMIDIDGHAYIADFGLAKPQISTIDDRAYSFCGSPEYMPPEMIMKEGHSLPVDFYCLGALLYELVTGLPPFYNTDPESIYQGTLYENLTFPQHAILTKDLEDLLQCLLCKDEKYRLGSTFGVQQILSHPWFKSVKKEDFRHRKVTPPVNFKRIQDLRFNIDEMQQDNQNQMKQILKNQKMQASSKYLKIMNGFYYDHRLSDNTDEKQNVEIEVQKGFTKNKNRLSTEKNKNNSQSIALTNCTKRSQNSLILGNHLDIKHLGNQQLNANKFYEEPSENVKSSLFKENKLLSSDKRFSRGLKSVDKRMFKDMKNFMS